MRAEQITIDLSTKESIADGVRFNGHIMVDNVNATPIVAWLKESKMDYSKYYFYINESINKTDRAAGKEPARFTPTAIAVKENKNGGFFASGKCVSYKGLEFPVIGNVDLDGENKAIELRLCSAEWIKKYEEKGNTYCLEINEPEGQAGGAEEEIPF